MRKECPEISWGDWKLLGSDTTDVLVMRYEFDGRAMVTVHNFGAQPRAVTFSQRDVRHPRRSWTCSPTPTGTSREHGKHVLELPPYCYRWFRVGGIDQTAPRT